MKGKANGTATRDDRVFGVLECKPIPISVQFAVEDVTEHRHFSCSNYDECLDVAVKKKWANFTCQECPTWEYHKRTQAAALEEAANTEKDS